MQDLKPISFGKVEKDLLNKTGFGCYGQDGFALYRKDEMLSILKGQYVPGVTWYQVRWETHSRGIYETLGEALFNAGAEYRAECPCEFC